jgi:uncharacterized membrane protein
MMEAFNALDMAQKVFWCVAIVASIAFVIQTIMTFIGLDSDTDVDAGGFEGVEADGVSGFFTLKNLVNFLLGYGWGGVAFHGVIDSTVGLQLAAVGVGLVFVLVWVVIIRQVMKLGVDKTFRIEDTVGMVADVYLRIPAARKAAGKVMVSVHGSVHELEAFTAGDEIPTGAKAKVTAAISSDSVLVEAI